jgi:hypothetical protein
MLLSCLPDCSSIPIWKNGQTFQTSIISIFFYRHFLPNCVILKVRKIGVSIISYRTLLVVNKGKGKVPVYATKMNGKVEV